MARNLHESKIGVALTKCFFCGENDRIVINTRLTERHAEAVDNMDGKVIDHEPCQKCKDLMKKGVMFISVKDGESGDNPYRTGKICVIVDDAIRRMLKDPSEVLRKRMAFIEETLWQRLGLPTPEIKEGA
jgi:hypothetical protein